MRCWLEGATRPTTIGGALLLVAVVMTAAEGASAPQAGNLSPSGRNLGAMSKGSLLGRNSRAVRGCSRASSRRRSRRSHALDEMAVGQLPADAGASAAEVARRSLSVRRALRQQPDWSGVQFGVQFERKWGAPRRTRVALASHIGTHGPPLCRSHNPKVAGSIPSGRTL